jgi:hypothetical protein
MKWILALGIALAIATMFYAWYRGGSTTSVGPIACS